MVVLFRGRRQRGATETGRREPPAAPRRPGRIGPECCGWSGRSAGGGRGGSRRRSASRVPQHCCVKSELRRCRADKRAARGKTGARFTARKTIRPYERLPFVAPPALTRAQRCSAALRAALGKRDGERETLIRGGLGTQSERGRTRIAVRCCLLSGTSPPVGSKRGAAPGSSDRNRRIRAEERPGPALGLSRFPAEPHVSVTGLIKLVCQIRSEAGARISYCIWNGGRGRFARRSDTDGTTRSSRG